MKNKKTEIAESEAGNVGALHAAFLDELADVYNAEQQLVKALPKMVSAAQSRELRAAFEKHLKETKVHVSRLKEVASKLGETLVSNTCEAMEGLIAEAEEMAGKFEDSPALDAVLIACAQKVEHYEIASYGTLIAWAKQTEHNEAAELLAETLEEEKAADEGLTKIAEGGTNEAGS